MTAASKALIPDSSEAFWSAPFSNKILTQSTYPLSAAKCKAV